MDFGRHTINNLAICPAKSVLINAYKVKVSPGIHGQYENFVCSSRVRPPEPAQKMCAYG